MTQAEKRACKTLLVEEEDEFESGTAQSGIIGKIRNNADYTNIYQKYIDARF